MATFVAQTTGVKGSDVYTTTGQPLLDLSVKLVRGANPDDLDHLVNVVMTQPSLSILEMIYVMAFHTRCIRGGKGERDLFRELIGSLGQHNSGLTLDLLDLVPHFGCWDDLNRLALAYPSTRFDVLELFKDQLLRDGSTVEGSISLAAKWAPREGKADHALAVDLAKLIFPGDPKALEKYRKMLSPLNARINTIETLMCSGRWAEINPQSVPGRAGKLYAKALLNLDSKGEPRYPDNDDRNACRENFVVHFAKAKEGKATVHGANTLFPHEVAKKAFEQRHSLSEDERSQLIVVWRSMVEKAKAGGGLKRTIFMSDFSGSMQSAPGTNVAPYWVSAALGALGAEVSEGAFHNKLMTFDSSPTWHTFAEGSDIFARMEVLRSGLGQGLSTDFQKAMDLILASLKTERVRPGEEPENIVVLTDMGWDQACASNGKSSYTDNTYRHHVKTDEWQTHIEMIRESFKRAGEDMWGVGWNPPRIVIWNLAASNSGDFHATADTPGVAMLSGWSPTLFEVLQTDGPRELTAMEMLNIELGNSRYDIVRERVREWIEQHP
jgi:Domain of unknown function (DUF2828)